MGVSRVSGGYLLDNQTVAEQAGELRRAQNDRISPTLVVEPQWLGACHPIVALEEHLHTASLHLS